MFCPRRKHTARGVFLEMVSCAAVYLDSDRKAWIVTAALIPVVGSYS